MDRKKDNPWNTYQSDMKEKGVTDKKVMQESWKNMSTTERAAAYGKPLEADENVDKPANVDKPGNVDNSGRVSFTCLDGKFVKEIESTIKSLEKDLVTSPFNGLAKMNGEAFNRSLAKYLIKIHDPFKNNIEIRGIEYNLMPNDFEEIMGVKEGEEPFDFSIQPSDKLIEDFVDYETKNPEKKKPFICRKKVVNMLKSGEILDAVRAYNLLSLMRIIIPSGRYKFDVKYLGFIDGYQNKRWASHAIEYMRQQIKNFQKGQDKSHPTVGGCVLFLQLFYMKKVSLTPSNDGIFLHTVMKEIVHKFIKDYEKLIEEYGSSGSTSRSKLEIFEDESKLLLELMERQKEKRRSNRDKATQGVIDRLYDGISTVLEKYFEEEKCSLDISDDNFSERNDTNQSRSPSLNDLGRDEDETAAIRDEDETSATGDEFVDVSAHVEETGAASNKRGKRKVHLVTRRYSLRSKEGSKE